MQDLKNDGPNRRVGKCKTKSFCMHVSIVSSWNSHTKLSVREQYNRILLLHEFRDSATYRLFKNNFPYSSLFNALDRANPVYFSDTGSSALLEVNIADFVTVACVVLRSIHYTSA